MNARLLPTATVCLALLGAAALPAYGLGTAFTYQGRLEQGGAPRNGSCDFQLGLFDAVGGGAQLGTTKTLSDVSVADGLFTVQLDFGAGVFTGPDRFLQIAVRCPAGGGTFTTLTPRQPLTPAPYALFAPAAGSAGDLTCTGCVGAGDLASGAVTATAIANATITANKLAFAPGTVTAITAGTGLSGGSITTSGTISNAGVLSVEATAPLASSGGQNPNVSLSGVVGLDNGGTGADTAAAARANLGAAASGANADITSLAGITGNIVLPDSADAVTGNIVKNDTVFMHNHDGTFLGVGAGSLSSALPVGDHNVGVGEGALRVVTTGADNTAVGSFALRSNTSGSLNTALGDSTLLRNTLGEVNTALGWIALIENVDGNSNTAMGASALRSNMSGDANTGLGADALARSTGDFNTAVGAAALSFNTTGNGNIAVGYVAGSQVTGSNNIAIGVAGVSGESGAIRIGDAQIHTSAFVAGINGQASASGTPVLVNSAGKLGTTVSSARYKQDVRDMGEASRDLSRLRPVTFRYRPEVDPSGLPQYGLIAEEVAAVYPELVATDAEGRPQAVRYQELDAMLLNELQQQQAQLRVQARRIADLEARLVALEPALDRCR